MMRFLIVIFLSIFISTSAISQTNKFGDKNVEKWLKQADKHIPEFHRDSIISIYPIYLYSSKKEYWKTKFSKIPTSYSEIDSLMDYEHLEIRSILAKTTDGIIWSLDGLDSKKKTYCHSPNSGIDILLFNYLDSVKVDKTYKSNITGSGLLIEKDGRRQLIDFEDGSWKECDLPDVLHMENVDEFNRWGFQINRPKKEVHVIEH